ncbi:WD40-repeat-containing domain [Pseudocohnilembus persalinus]|uniref:Dynein axonemal intermediate chain 4 n=1 Tax=Pseudocohnilembus persalinus TaxID=266149 RepID=A0A0V0R3H8_PSEPJ|nr:WD40-repeat-containing domain [Pseudocohnilembus persalinus]|eukprot:KRX09068.1 WD40-repeat-containing domain [Pseudocohnilembus persalinus]
MNSQIDSNTLRAQSTRTLQKGNLRSGPTANRTRLGAGITSRNNQFNKKANQSNMRTNASDKDNEYVKEGSYYVTPKKLISDKRNQMSKTYKNQENEEQEKNQEMKKSQSQIESSQLQSMDRSSGSDKQMSSSEIKDSTLMESKRSEDESLDESRVRRDEARREKKRQLTEADKEQNISINLQETETQFIFYIPSSLIPGDAKAKDSADLNTPLNKLDSDKKLEIWRRNHWYQQHQKEIVGSDLFQPRQAQTFNYEPKTKEQQARKVERFEKGCFSAVWDLYDVEQQDQQKDYEIIQEKIKKKIENEFKQKMKNPFCLLPTDTKAINIHTKQEVPGAFQEIVSSQPRKPGMPTGLTNYQQTNQFNSTTKNYLSQDETNRSSSGIAADYSGKHNIGRTMTKQYGRTMDTEQIKQQKKALQEQLDKEEEELIKVAQDKAREQKSDEYQSIMTSDSLKTYLVKMHSVSIDDGKKKNNYLNALLQQNKQNQEEEEEQKTETLDQLFKFNIKPNSKTSSQFSTQNKTVSSADWNPVNNDLLAVTYGSLDLDYNTQVNSEGYVMFWTLKSPDYPERIIKYPQRLTSCKFSSQNPNLLACGSYDGVVAIWDLRKKGDIPVAENGPQAKKEIAGKHTDAIWEVHWVGKGNKGGADKGEGLVSISSDGRIVEWSMKKGLEYTDLMNLKRSQNPSNKETANEGVNFRQAAGFSIDFLKGESSMYLAATEDGAIHRCSKSYSEQYLDSYFGHTGPVFRVRCNPFWSDIFLTCSADWTCKLWNWRQEKPLANFQSLDLYDEVMDVQWSPDCSNLFASVCKDGRLELWDLEKNNMLDPYAQVKAQPGQYLPAKTMVRFANNAPVIVTGDVAGDVNVYRIHGYEDQVQQDQTEKLQKLLYPTGYNKNKGEREEDNEQQ